MTQRKYTELCTVRISETKNLVISLTDDNEIIIAQNYQVKDDMTGNIVRLYAKGAFIMSPEALVNFRDSIDIALQKYGHIDSEAKDGWER